MRPMRAGSLSAIAQSKAASQWTAPPPERAHNAGFAIAMEQWAAASCGGKMGDFFKESMTIFGRQHAQAFNIGHTQGTEQMRQLAARFPTARTLIKEGTPRSVILEVAADLDVDLIVMGTHGRTGLAHVFFGSVAEFVVRHSRIPVLTARQEESS